MNGSLKQNFLVQLVKDWATYHGWPWKIGFQFRAMDVAGSTLFVWGKVTGLLELERYGLVELELGIRNQGGAVHTGNRHCRPAVSRWAAVPYPFVPPSPDEIVKAKAKAEKRAV